MKKQMTQIVKKNWRRRKKLEDPHSLTSTIVQSYSNQNDSMKVKWKSLSHVQLFVTPLTIQSMEFSRPEY